MTVFETIWAEQYMRLLAAGGLQRKGGRPINTPAERWGLAAAAYSRAYAALAGDKVLLDVSPLRERLDKAASESLDLLLAELTEDQVSGLAAFWIFTMSKAGQRFRQSSGKTGKGKCEMADKNDVWLMQLAESIKATVKQIESFDGTLTEQQAMGIATSMTTLQKAVERMFHGKVRIGDAK